MGSFGPVHKIIVHEVGAPYGPLSTEDFADYEVVHPDECPQVTEDRYTRYTCAVEFNIDGCGARFSLKYTGCAIDKPGTYEIQAWSEVYRGFDYTEYDGGICQVEARPLAAQP